MKNANRVVRVTYRSGLTITTEMNSNLTDDDIKAYFRVNSNLTDDDIKAYFRFGRTFNVGFDHKQEDVLDVVACVEILK